MDEELDRSHTLASSFDSVSSSHARSDELTLLRGIIRSLSAQSSESMGPARALLGQLHITPPSEWLDADDA